MKELSLHILDLVQNSVHANAKNISISIFEDSKADSYEISISDNGCGMTKDTLSHILDPFFTTKSKKTGLGIPLLKQHAELTGGDISIESTVNKGTKVNARFVRSSIDRQPLGDIVSTITGLIRSYSEIDFEYKHKVDNKDFTFSTKEIKIELDGIPLQSGEIIGFISEMIKDNLKEINAT